VPTLYHAVPNKYPTLPTPDNTGQIKNMRHIIVPELHQPQFDEQDRFQEVPRGMPYQGAAGGVTYQAARGGGEYQEVVGEVAFQEGAAAPGVGYQEPRPRQATYRAVGKYV